MKKYFVCRIIAFTEDQANELDVECEVSHDEYVILANRQFMADCAETMERILENATKETRACGTTHMFWTEES